MVGAAIGAGAALRRVPATGEPATEDLAPAFDAIVFKDESGSIGCCVGGSVRSGTAAVEPAAVFEGIGLRGALDSTGW